MEYYDRKRVFALPVLLNGNNTDWERRIIKLTRRAWRMKDAAERKPEGI